MVVLHAVVHGMGIVAWTAGRMQSLLLLMAVMVLHVLLVLVLLT